MAMLLIAGCDKKSTETIVEDPPFKQTVNVAAEGGRDTVTLEKLTSKISEINQEANWVSASKMAYTSGAPQILLTINENTGDTRQTNITIKDESEKTVILTVKQMKPGDTPEEEPEKVKDGIDDIHDTVTDQPASSRIK